MNTENTSNSNNELCWADLHTIFPKPDGKPLSDREMLDLIAKMAATAILYAPDFEGNWETQSINGCLFLVAPRVREKYEVNVESNFYQGQMSPETFGAALTLLIFNHRIWEFSYAGYPVGHLSDRYYSMVDAACSSSLDAAAIGAFLD